MATFHFELVSPERVLFSGEVDAVILPATEGDMTVLPGHAPVMTALKTGFLVITDAPRQRHAACSCAAASPTSARTGSPCSPSAPCPRRS